MTIGAIRGQRRSKRMIGSTVLSGKDAMTGIALGANTLTGCDRYQSSSRTVAGAACTMVPVRAAHRHPARHTLSACVASRTVNGKANQTTMILTDVN